MRYVSSPDDARRAIQELVFSSKKPAISKPRHGIGVKKRVLYMVSDLSDLNDGKGVNRRRVLDECRDAGIDIDRAKHFLNQLQEEGSIIEIDDKLQVVPEE